MIIKDITALEILDSRGNPTVSATVTLEDGSRAGAMVPSGASTGTYEAKELRDDDSKRFSGKGVLKAVANIENIIAPALKGMSADKQEEIDNKMIELDGTSDKSKLGANAILAVSLAVSRVAAVSLKIPLYEYLARFNSKFSGKYVMPRPMMNVLNGGQHANFSSDIQEYMIMPLSAKTITEAIKMGAEVYASLKQVLKEKKYSVLVGDEGGFAPLVKNNTEPFVLLSEAIEKAGYAVGKDISFAIDAAASEFYRDGKYHLQKENKIYDAEELASFYQKIINEYPLLSLEDVFSEDDWDSFALFTKKNKNLQIVGDDLYVTNLSRLEKGIEVKASNSILIKLNQIGTLTETIKAIELAHKSGMTTVISHRSGETEDSYIADLAVAMCSGQIKTGALSRSERISKYNRLMEIEKELNGNSSLGSWPF
jgi:enolase